MKRSRAVEITAGAALFLALAAVVAGVLYYRSLNDALARAVEDGDAGRIGTLLRRGARLDARGRHGGMALHAAVRADDPALVKRLLACGVNVDAPNRNGLTPLWYAGGWGSDEVALVLIDAGADVNAGRSAVLKPAAQEGRVTVLKELIRAGAHVNARDAQGGTALMSAVSRGHGRAVRLLLEHGADVNAVCTDGTTALDIARRHYRAKSPGRRRIIQILIAAGAKERPANPDQMTSR